MASREQSGQFRITYDGDGLDSIDVNDLAPALLGLGEAVDAINAEITGGTQSIRVRVRVGFQPGSFNIDLELVRAGYQGFVELFNGRQAVAWGTFFSILGVGGVGLIQLFRRSRGRQPRGVVELENGRVRVEFESGSSDEIDKSLWRLFNSPGVRAGFTRLVKPLKSEEISTLELRAGASEAEQITADEADYFSVPAAHEGELVTESERVLRVVGLSFKAGNKWKVTEGASAYSVTIADPDFLRRVQSGAERFGANDYLRVTLQTKQWTEGGVLKASYTVSRVLSVLRSPTQARLPFEEAPEESGDAG